MGFAPTNLRESRMLGNKNKLHSQYEIPNATSEETEDCVHTYVDSVVGACIPGKQISN